MSAILISTGIYVVCMVVVLVLAGIIGFPLVIYCMGAWLSALVLDVVYKGIHPSGEWPGLGTSIGILGLWCVLYGIYRVLVVWVLALPGLDVPAILIWHVVESILLIIGSVFGMYIFESAVERSL